MNHYSLYSLETGLFDGRTLDLPSTMLALNTPPGMGAIEGHFDHRAWRVDLASVEVTPWEAPPVPQADLDAAARRLAMQQVAVLERGQARAMRALMLDPNDQAARARLAEIEAAIAATGIRQGG